MAEKSSVGRLGIHIQSSTGMGNVGFCNHWTLEISVTQSVKIYAGMPIAQLLYFTLEGTITASYAQNSRSKYTERNAKPVESMLWKNKF